MSLLIQYTILYASVLILVALGGCFSEHSGVINLGLEGIMVMGALGGALTMKYMIGYPPAVIVILTILAAAVTGLVFSALLAVACINFKADQTIVGTALNMLGLAAATVIVKAINIAENPDNVSATVQYIAQKKSFLVNIGGFEFNWMMLVALVILIAAYIVLQDQIRPAPDGLRRAPPGGGLGRYKRLQDALVGRSDIRRSGRTRRHYVHHCRRERVAV